MNEELKNQVYESFDKNEITIEEKCDLLNMIEMKELGVYEERLETNIIDRVGNGTKYDLYHVSSGKFDVIKANSLNMGTLLSKMRLSSFWTRDIDLAYMWAAYFYTFDFLTRRYIGASPVLAIKERKIYLPEITTVYAGDEKYLAVEDKIEKDFKTILDGIDKKFQEKYGKSAKEKLDKDGYADLKLRINGMLYTRYAVYVDTKTKEIFEKHYKDHPHYLYTKKDVPIKEIGRGQYDIDEYTIDTDVSFDSVKEIPVSDLLKRVEFVKDDAYKEKKSKSDSSGYKSSNLVNRVLYSGKDKKIEKRMKMYRDLSDAKMNGGKIPKVFRPLIGSLL